MSRKYTALATGMAAAAAVTMVVAGCSSSTGARASSSTGASASSSTGASPSSGTGASGKNLELVVGTKSDDFYVTMECGAKAEAQALGVNLTVTGPTDFSASEQAPILNAVAVSKPDALIVAPTDSSALNPELSRIAGEGVKLVFVDTTTTGPSLAVSRITTNNVAGGALAADRVEETSQH